MRKVVRAFALVALAFAAASSLAPQDASAHGRRHYRDRPIVIAPPGHRVQPHPYWYYGRPEPRHYAPPVIVGPRHYERPHRRHHHRPGATFEFRF